MSRVIRFTPWIAVVLLVLATQSADAQATRTWVSGVGDDANPCSRTAPCKTFAGAISKTATAGEISVLDPGGFGAVTITKSISIVAASDEGGILAAGTNGIVINAPATATINLKGLVIEGVGTALNGIRFLAGGSLHVQDCIINNTVGVGIAFEPSGAAELYVRNTVIRNNNGAAGGGILVKPGAAGSAAVTLDGVELSNNRFGMRVEDRSKVTVRNSLAAGNQTNGFLLITTAVASELNLESTVSSNNTTGAGLRSDGAFSTARISNFSSFNNNNGLQNVGGGLIVSFGQNRIAGNAANGTPTSTTPQQ